MTVKRGALASAWLHDNMAPGRQLKLRGIEGSFTPRPGAQPVLLLAGGIRACYCITSSLNPALCNFDPYPNVDWKSQIVRSTVLSFTDVPEAYEL